MIVLANILQEVSHELVQGSELIVVHNLCIDSRKVEQGSCFIAIKGTQTDGHDYIDKAIAQGANSIICEQLPAQLQAATTYVVTANTALAAGRMAAAFYGYPSAGLKVIGVTGTNGKTTVATLLFQLFENLGYVCGLISTVQNHIHLEVLNATHTTPDAIAVQHLLSQMRDAGCEYVFMEVSSHAVHQHRIEGIEFTGGLFTNITHDHLDYHGTFDAYIKAKKSFFDTLSQKAFALTNLDDKRGEVMLQNTKARRKTYSLRQPADYKGKILENNLSGLVMTINQTETHFRMIGTFNAYNLLAVYGAAIELGQEAYEVLQIMSQLTGARGRFETIISPIEGVIGIIDYAHTPDALLNVLQTIKQMRTNYQQVFTVIGCGGDRDKEKRPLMAQVAVEYSDVSIFTSDNPRSEDPEAILDDMEAGLTLTQKRKTLRITNRKEAIKTACTLAQAGDVVLVAGKGHETYQEVRGVRQDFDDRQVLIATFQILNK